MPIGFQANFDGKGPNMCRGTIEEEVLGYKIFSPPSVHVVLKTYEWKESVWKEASTQTNKVVKVVKRRLH